MTLSSDTRGLTSVVGYALLIGIIIVASMSVFIVGFATVNDAQALSERSSAKQAMTVFNSKASLVAFGGSENQHVTIPTTGRSNLHVKSTGQLRVTLIGVNKTHPTQTHVVKVLYNQSFGTLVLNKQDYKIAYQGGGVWAMYTGNVNTSTLVSPPEFSYTKDTATIPIVGINKTSHVTGGELVLHKQSQQPIFPVGSSNNTTNPVSPYHNLKISITSDYYQAWGEYFKDHMGIQPNYDHANNTVTIYLVGEREASGVMSNGITSTAAENRITIKGSGEGNTFIDSYNSEKGIYTVSQTSNGTISAVTGIAAKGHVAFYGTVETTGDLILKGQSCVHGDAIVDGAIISGGNGGGSCPVTGERTTGATVEAAPIADGVIANLADTLSQHNDNNETPVITDETVGKLEIDGDSAQLGPGAYYIEGLKLDDDTTLTINVTNGDVQLLVEDGISIKGTINVVGNQGTNHRAQIYTRGHTISFDNVHVTTEGMEAAGMWFYGPAGTDIILDDHSKVTGVIYAAGTPSSPGSVTLETHSEIFGSVVGGTTTIKSQSKVHQDLALMNDPVFQGAIETRMFWTTVQYFHISKTTINVTSV